MSPKKTPIINDFRAGELTPGLDARHDIKDYYRGCRTLENMRPIIEGGVAKVSGTYYVRPVKTDEGWYIRITKSGNGSGMVTSDITPGIDCGSSCYFFFPAGSTVVLTPVPDGDSTFTGWSGCGFSGTNPISIYMDGNKDINAEFSGIPQNDYLIGWYKFNEGSGLIVTNSAGDGSGGGGLLPNLTVFNSFEGSFWSYLVGFGSTKQLYFGGGLGADFAWSKPNRTIGGPNKMTMGIFVKRIFDIGNKGGYIIASRSLPYEGTLGHRLQTCNPGIAKGYDWTWASGLGFAYDVSLLNVWLFHFLDSDGKYRIVKPDGTILISAASTNLTSVCQYIYAFAGVSQINADPPIKGYYPGGGSYGDWIIYNQKTLTLAEWAQWYNRLRSRYGMAARSGW